MAEDVKYGTRGRANWLSFFTISFRGFCLPRRFFMLINRKGGDGYASYSSFLYLERKESLRNKKKISPVQESRKRAKGCIRYILIVPHLLRFADLRRVAVIGL